MQIDITAPDADGRQNVQFAGVQVGYFEPTVGASGAPAFQGFHPFPHGDRHIPAPGRMLTAPDAARWVLMSYIRCHATVRES